MAAPKTTTNPIAVVTVELIGVALLALLATVNDQVGKIIVIIMVGVAIAWGISHTGFLTTLTGKA